MRIAYETAAAPGRPHNEDFVVAGPDWVAVLDGATAPAGVASGCVHDVPWLVARLGGALAHRLATGRGRACPTWWPPPSGTRWRRTATPAT